MRSATDQQALLAYIRGPKHPPTARAYVRRHFPRWHPRSWGASEEKRRLGLFGLYLLGIFALINPLILLPLPFEIAGGVILAYCFSKLQNAALNVSIGRKQHKMIARLTFVLLSIPLILMGMIFAPLFVFGSQGMAAASFMSLLPQYALLGSIWCILPLIPFLIVEGFFKCLDYWRDTPPEGFDSLPARTSLKIDHDMTPHQLPDQLLIPYLDKAALQEKLGALRVMSAHDDDSEIFECVKEGLFTPGFTQCIQDTKTRLQASTDPNDQTLYRYLF